MDFLQIVSPLLCTAISCVTAAGIFTAGIFTAVELRPRADTQVL